jgi:predicted metal-dependent hydrolase
VEPKNEKLHLMAQRLQETERECETAHKALSDKDSLLSLKTAGMQMLQKQVRDLRNRSASKDSALQRAAVLLEQYQQMMLAADITAAAAQSINMRTSRAKASLTNKSGLLSLSSTGPVDLLGASKGTQRLLGASLKTVPSTSLSADEVILKKSNHAIALQRLSEVLRPHLTATASANNSNEADYDVS